MQRAQSAHICVLKPNGVPAGGAVLVGENTVVTCAHVAALGWGQEMDLQHPLEAPLDLVFPWREGEIKNVSVKRLLHWNPYRARGVGGSDLAIFELKESVDGWAPIASTSESLRGDEAYIHGHHANGKVGARIDCVLVGEGPDGRLQLGGGNREGGYFVAPGASGCGVFFEDRLVGIVAAYDPSPDLREAFSISIKLIHEALGPIIGEQDRSALRLAPSDEFVAAAENLAVAEVFCPSQEARKDGLVRGWLDASFGAPSLQQAPMFRAVELLVNLPSGCDAVTTAHPLPAEQAAHVTVSRKNGSHRPSHPHLTIRASDGATLCDTSVTLSQPVLLISGCKPGDKVRYRMQTYANHEHVTAGFIDDIELPEGKTSAIQKLIARLELKKIGEPDPGGAIVLCEGSAVVEPVGDPTKTSLKHEPPEQN